MVILGCNVRNYGWLIFREEQFKSIKSSLRFAEILETDYLGYVQVAPVRFSHPGVTCSLFPGQEIKVSKDNKCVVFKVFRV